MEKQRKKLQLACHSNNLMTRNLTLKFEPGIHVLVVICKFTRRTKTTNPTACPQYNCYLPIMSTIKACHNHTNSNIYIIHLLQPNRRKFQPRKKQKKKEINFSAVEENLHGNIIPHEPVLK